MILAATVGGGALVIDAGEFREFSPPPPGLELADGGPSDPEREIESVLAIGMGARRPLADRVAVALEARDLVHLCRDPSEFFANTSRMFCDRDAWLHHLQLTAALRFEF